MRPTHAVVDLGALSHNIREIRNALHPNCIFMAVMKADAYGHGLVESAQAAVQAGAGYLGVAIPAEGALLREAGIDAPVLVMGGILEDDAPIVVAHDLTQTVFSKEICAALARAAQAAGKRCKVHIKVDTGMNRIGLRTIEDFSALLAFIDACPQLTLEGVFTHFAVSDTDKDFTRLQCKRFNEYTELVKHRNLLLHSANSGAALDLTEETQMNMVRCGLAMYGARPSEDCGLWANLKPVLSWKTSIIQLKEITAGDTVSYGRAYTATKTRKIATLPVGYGDGYMRRMSGRASVLIRGQRAPVVGVICMDQCLADVTGIDGVCVGDEAMLIGAQGADRIHAEELAAWADTINYEVLLNLSPRVPRLYIQ